MYGMGKCKKRAACRSFAIEDVSSNTIQSIDRNIGRGVLYS